MSPRWKPPMSYHQDSMVGIAWPNCQIERKVEILYIYIYILAIKKQLGWSLVCVPSSEDCSQWMPS